MNAQKRMEYVNAHPELGIQTREEILNGRLRLGMKPEQVIASWGKPTRKNRSVNPARDRELWIYESGGIRYVLFDDGVVSGWHE